MKLYIKFLLLPVPRVLHELETIVRIENGKQQT